MSKDRLGQPGLGIFLGVGIGYTLWLCIFAGLFLLGVIPPTWALNGILGVSLLLMLFALGMLLS